jgi:hypothetical protein
MPINEKILFLFYLQYGTLLQNSRNFVSNLFHLSFAKERKLFSDQNITTW